MTVSSSSGTKVFIHPPVSATNARYLDQLSDWVEIGEVEDIDDIGETFGVVQRTSFGNGPRTDHLKTVITGSAVSVSIGHDYDDNGQSILNDALSSRDSYLFKVELNDARFVDYANSRLIFRALVLGVNTAVGGNDNIVRRNATLQINSEIYELPSEPQSDANVSLSLDFVNNRGVVVSPNSPLFQPASEVVIDTHATDILALGSGGYETFAPNVPPITDLGLLSTVRRTNLYTRSNDPSSSAWNKNQVTVGASVDGWTPIRETTENNFHRLARASPAAISSGSLYTDSFVVRKAGRRYIGVRTSTGGTPNFLNCGFDLDANGGEGEVTFASAGRSGDIRKLAADTYLVSVTWTATDTTAATHGIFTAQSPILNNNLPSFVGDPAAGVDLYNVQLEEGPFATDPIITEGSAVTRPGNRPVIDLTGRLGEGVAGVYQMDWLGVEAFKVQMDFNDGTSANRVGIETGSGGGPRWSGTLDGADQGVGAISDGVFRKTGLITVAFGVGEGFRSLRVVGDTQRNDHGKPLPTGLSMVGIGGSGRTESNNTFAQFKRLALKFGPQDQASFDAMYALAQEWAAE